MDVCFVLKQCHTTRRYHGGKIDTGAADHRKSNLCHFTALRPVVSLTTYPARVLNIERSLNTGDREPSRRLCVRCDGMV